MNVDEAKKNNVDEDMELISLCRKGNVDSFERIVKKYQKNLWNIIYRILNNYEEANEIVQEVFICAYKGLKDFRGDAKFSTWLYRIAINLSRNRLKKMKKKRYYEKFSIDDFSENDGTFIRRKLVCNKPLATEIAEKKELKEKISECINLLEDEFKEVLILRDIEGLTYSEIENILNIPEGTVKSRLSRARKFIIEQMRNHLKRV